VAQEKKAINLRIDLPKHQTFRDAAERDGRSIQNWALRQLELAAREQTGRENTRQQTGN
jgi:hypothetical protein